MALAKLSIDFEARLGQFEAELKRISSVSDSVAKNLTSAFKGIGLSLVGGLGGAGLVNSIKSTINEMDGLSKAAQRVGITVEDLSALNFAGSLSGVQLDELTTGLTRLSVKMKEAVSGNKEAATLFKDLGVAVTNSSGQLKSADAVFAEVAEKLTGMEQGAGKTAIAVDLFGKSGARLVPLLNQGAAGLTKMRTEAEAFGAVIDGNLARQAEEFNDNLERLGTVSAAVGRSIAAELLPSLTAMTGEMSAAIQASGGFGNYLKNVFSLDSASVADNLTKITKQVGELEDRISIGRGKKGDTEDLARLQSRMRMLKAIDDQRTAMLAKGLGINDILGKPLQDDENPDKPPKPKIGGGGQDDYSKLIQSLNEKIAVETLGITTTEKLSAAEKDFAKYQADLSSGAIRVTATQQGVIDAYWETYRARAAENEEAQKWRQGIDAQTEAMIKQRQSMIDSIQIAEREAELFGLNAAQISVVEQARLADAIAIAKQNGVSEEQIKVLEDELALRSNLSDALIKKETKSQQQKDAEDAIAAVNELDEFTKSAAQNMQTAMADFLFDPAAKGFRGMEQQFGEAVKRMIAEAASAQLMKQLLGSYGGGKAGDTGLLGGLLKAFSGIGGSSSSGSGFSAADLAFFDNFTFASGGIMTSAGPLPLNRYAFGGVATSPQLAMFGEGSTPEAYVPLPDGRNIPVKMQGHGGGGNSVNVTQHIVVNGNGDPAEIRRSAASGARSVLGVVNSSRRYT